MEESTEYLSFPKDECLPAILPSGLPFGFDKVTGLDYTYHR